jgi:hypothetical protein
MMATKPHNPMSKGNSSVHGRCYRGADAWHNLKLDTLLNKGFCFFAASAEKKGSPPLSRTMLPFVWAFSTMSSGYLVLGDFVFACAFANVNHFSFFGG